MHSVVVLHLVFCTVHCDSCIITYRMHTLCFKSVFRVFIGGCCCLSWLVVLGCMFYYTILLHFVQFFFHFLTLVYLFLLFNISELRIFTVHCDSSINQQNTLFHVIIHFWIVLVCMFLLYHIVAFYTIFLHFLNIDIFCSVQHERFFFVQCIVIVM
jgi:hypothetical protein